ncbi:hypothetical protein ACV34F_30030, partial [Pseudomonas aeruginosa]
RPAAARLAARTAIGHWPGARRGAAKRARDRWRLASGQWLFWLPAALLLGGGLYACLAGVFLYRRHGQVALTLTPESIAFANAPQ